MNVCILFCSVVVFILFLFYAPHITIHSKKFTLKDRSKQTNNHTKIIMKMPAKRFKVSFEIHLSFSFVFVVIKRRKKKKGCKIVCTITILFDVWKIVWAI